MTNLLFPIAMFLPSSSTPPPPPSFSSNLHILYPLSELSEVLWQMALQKYGITFAVDSVPLGVIILFFLWAFWAGEEGGKGGREVRREEGK